MHCFLYTMCIASCTGWPLLALAVVFALHFAQDRTGFVRWWMHTAGQDAFAEPPLAPWSIIVVDNVMHLVVLWVIDGAIARLS